MRPSCQWKNRSVILTNLVSYHETGSNALRMSSGIPCLDQIIRHFESRIFLKQAQSVGLVSEASEES